MLNIKGGKGLESTILVSLIACIDGGNCPWTWRGSVSINKAEEECVVDKLKNWHSFGRVVGREDLYSCI